MSATTTRAGLPYPVGTDRVMDGDNIIAALAKRLDGTDAAAVQSVPYAVAAGQSNISISSATQAQVAITFPTGRFSQVPVVQMSVQSAGTANMYELRMTAPPTTAGFTAVANLAAAGTITIPVGWIAMQMTSTSAWG